VLIRRFPMLLAILLAACVPLAIGGSAETRGKALDPANMDLSVRPGDDFFLYANGSWLKKNPIPADRESYGSWSILDELNEGQLHAILEEAAAKKDAPKGSNIQKIGDFYACGMDEAKINSDGVTPLKEELDRIASIRTKADLQRAIEAFQMNGAAYPFAFGAEKDQESADLVIAWIVQGGLGLPDRDYYVDESDRSKKLREEYLVHVAKMFEALGENKDAASQMARTVMDVETRLAKASFTRIEFRDPQALNNKLTLVQLNDLAKGFDFTAYFRQIGIGDPGKVNVVPSKFFAELGSMVEDVPLEAWKTYLRWQVVHEAAPYLSTSFVDENFRFYGTVLSGIPAQRDRWKRVLDATNGALRDAVGQVFVERHFPPEAKMRAKEMVRNMRLAFAERIKKLDWMSDETKKKALEKLEAFTVKIGYPDVWRDYSMLEIKRDSYVRNIIRAGRYEFQRNLAKVNKPADRTEWQMGPQTINAYNNPFLNEIVFPAAILQPPFFDFTADDAVNYGGIGAVIGHEMTHGFDDQGRHYGKDGTLMNWWTKEDEERFAARTDVLVKQYDGYKVADDAPVNGKLTLGENIADLGGLLIGLDGLQMALQKNPTPEIDGFTPEQRLFLSWAQVWRRNVRPEALVLQVKTDEHPPASFRVIGPLANIDAFYTAYSVTEKDKMYRPAGERARIW